MADQLAVRELSIPGMFEIDLVMYNDARGWFKENYQQAKMDALGLPHFQPVQNNFSFNSDLGVTRGLHAEPWNKFISLANGKAFGAWVDLRPGPGFGRLLTLEMTPNKAFYVPRGVANGYQTLEPDMTYTYLVDAHWSPDAKYVAVNLFDSKLGIQWPISQDKAVVSEKDQANPMLETITPMEI